MTTFYAASSAVLFSLLCLLLLVRTDAKRHRRRASYFAVSSRLRPATGLLALAPAIVLPALGEYSGLLIWLGSVTVLGWALAVLPPRLL